MEAFCAISAGILAQFCQFLTIFDPFGGRKSLSGREKAVSGAKKRGWGGKKGGVRTSTIRLAP